MYKVFPIVTKFVQEYDQLEDCNDIKQQQIKIQSLPDLSISEEVSFKVILYHHSYFVFPLPGCPVKQYAQQHKMWL